jgi:hypothetical protein
MIAVYMSYSNHNEITRGWSRPERIYEIPRLYNGYSYAFHAYPNYDPTGRVVPFSWTEFAMPNTFHISMANATFS